MARYSIEPRARKYIKGCGFLSFARNVSVKYGKKLLDSATKTGLDAIKTASKTLVHKTAETTGELAGYKIAEKLVKSKLVPVENSKSVEEIEDELEEMLKLLYQRKKEKY